MGLVDGQVAWVTGGGRGIGRAAALALAAHGAAVAVSARTESEVDRVSAEIRARGGRSLAYRVDVSAWSAVEAGAKRIEAALGPIDILINNAASLTPLGRLWRTDPDAWGRLIATNLTGPYYCMRAVLPGMVERGRGVIVNVGSGAASSAAPGMSAYSASKAGLEHLARCLAADLAGTPIRVHVLRPGLIETRMQETVRAASDEEMPRERRQYFRDQQAAGHVRPPEIPAGAIVWLCSTLCDVESGGVVDLRGHPEHVTRIEQALSRAERTAPSGEGSSGPGA